MSRSALAILIIYFLQVFGNLLAVPTVRESDSANPCRNYFSYVCKDKDIDNTLGRLDKNLIIEYYFRRINDTKIVTPVERKYFDFKKQCAQPNSQDKKDLIQLLKFPNYNKGSESGKFDLQAAIAEMLSAGIPPFYSLSLYTEDQTFENRLNIETVDIVYGMSYKYARYRDVPFSEFIDNGVEVINDGHSVTDIYVNLRNRYEYTVEITDVKGLKEKIPEFDWDMQIEATFGKKLPDDYRVHIHNYEVLKRFIPATLNVRPEVMVNYLLFKLLDFTSRFDEQMISHVFEPVRYHIFLKHFYTEENRKKFRSMLHSFLTTVNKLAKMSNNEKEFNDEATEFINKDILPNVNDEFVSNMYKDIEINSSNCLYTYYKLFKISNEIRYKRRLERRFDYLSLFESHLKNSLAERLPLKLNKTSPYKFQAFFLNTLTAHSNLMRGGLASYKVFQECLQEQKDGLYIEDEFPEALQTQLLIKAYFEWIKSNEEFIQQEEQTFNFNAKTLIFENFIGSLCGKSPGVQERYSYYLANMDEFSEVYHCPIGNLNLENKCQLK